MSCLFAGMWLQGAWTRSAGSWHFCRISICLFAKALKQVISQIFKLGKHIFSPTIYLFAIVFVPVFTKCLSQREKRRERPCSPAFVLSACVWTRVGASPIQNALCGRAASGNPSPYTSHTQTHTGSTSPACAHFPLNSFTLKMLFCSVWRCTQLSQSGLPADTPHQAVAIFQHPWEIEEPAGTTGRFIQMFTHFIHFQPWFRTLNEIAFTKKIPKKQQKNKNPWSRDAAIPWLFCGAAGRRSNRLVLRDWPLKCTLNCKAKQMIKSESCLNPSL